jgi:signal transduction histidine kinase
MDLSDYVIAPDEGIAGLVFTQGQPINVKDTRLEPRASAYAHALGLRSLLVVPVLARNRRLGTISLHCTEPGAFTETDERSLTILAAQAGLAIENAHLFDSQRRARTVAELQRERLRVMTDRIVTAQEEERLRISRELHDEAGQALTSLKISLDLLRGSLSTDQAPLRSRLADLSNLTGETMDKLRTLAHDLRPPGLDAFGLNVALEGLCHDFLSRAGLTFHYEGLEMPDLPNTVALSMYRIAQEALTNIAKHAEATTVDIRLAYEDGCLTLSITDDGRGFAFDPNTNQGGVGLVSMQERTDLLGGSLEVDTAPGRGTRLSARVPVEFSETPTAAF